MTQLQEGKAAPAGTRPAKAGRRQPSPAPPGIEHGEARPAAGWVSSYPVHRRTRNFMTARWRWIVFVTLVVVAGAAMLSWSRTPAYRSSADVVVQPRVFSVGTPPQAPDMGSEKAVAQSAAVVAIAAKALGVPASTVASGLSVSVPLNTHVLHISYTSRYPVVAQRRAQAVADAYVRYWIAQQPLLVSDSRSGPQRQPTLNSSVISAAKLPSTPASPHHNVDVGIAVLIGLTIAIGTAYLRDRLDDRLRGSADLERNASESVLAVVPPVGILRRSVSPVLRDPNSRGATVYADLATIVTRITADRAAASILVTSPVGDAQVAVSSNLALALAAAGHRVVLVYADLRRPPAREVFAVDATSGLAGVLEGDTDLAAALQPSQVAGLQVIPAGVVTGNVGRALHSVELRKTLCELQVGVDIVVIDGPPVLAGADIASIADVADAIVLVADGRRTTRSQVQAAAERLRPVRTKFVGCVLENLRGRFRAPVRLPTYRRRIDSRTTLRQPEHPPTGLLKWLDHDESVDTGFDDLTTPGAR
jgi:capsular exopolysaccharide synthesis family protein